MKDKLKVKVSEKHTLFNPSFIDDYGLTPEEFRVFARIMRRSLGSDQGCFESIPNMAKSLQIGEALIRQSLRVLESCGAITRTVRKGETDLLDFNTCDQWKPSKQLAAIRESFEAERKRKDRERQKRLKNKQVVTDNAGVTPIGKRRGVVSENTGVVVTDNEGKGIPTEGNPIKEETPADANGAGKLQPRVETPSALSASSDSKRDVLPRSVEIYYEAFSKETLGGERLKLFIKRLPVVNETVWRQTLDNWKLDGHRSGNLSGMIDRYEKEIARLPKITNGIIQHDTKPKAKFLH